MQRDPTQLKLSAPAKTKFAETFGIAVDDAVAAGSVHTAATALEALRVSSSEFQELWLAAGCTKLGPGVYAAKMSGPGDVPIYVFNGFYASLRDKFVRPGVEVTWYEVRFDPAKLSWATFRGEVIGSTDPAKAVEGSLRAKFRDEWQALGLKAEFSHIGGCDVAGSPSNGTVRYRTEDSRVPPPSSSFSISCAKQTSFQTACPSCGFRTQLKRAVCRTDRRVCCRSCPPQTTFPRCSQLATL